MITALIVASDPAARDLAASRLPPRRLQTLEAATAWEAMLLLRSESVDLVLLSEEDDDGLTAEILARTVRETSPLERAPVIVVSLRRLPDERRRTLYLAGADAVVDLRRLDALPDILETFMLERALPPEDRDGPRRWVVEAAVLLDEEGNVIDLDARARRVLGREGHGRWLSSVLPDLSVVLGPKGHVTGIHETSDWPGEDGRRECRSVALSRKEIGRDLTVRGVVFLAPHPSGRASARLASSERRRTRAYELCGPSAALQVLRASLLVGAASRSPLLLRGPRGCRADQLARVVHHEARTPGAFVAIRAWETEWIALESRMASDPGGCELGRLRGGTLFVSDLATMPDRLQRLLAGAMSRRAFGVRLIASVTRGQDAASLDPALVELFGRRVVEVPALCERPEDVGPNARRVLGQFEPTARLTPAGEALLAEHDWPGDLEQLEAVVAGLGLDHPGRTIPLEAIVARLDRGRTRTSPGLRLLASGRVLRLPVRGRHSPDAGPLSRSLP